jgi:hypothetical protein
MILNQVQDSGKSIMHKRVFITGCDSNTRWMLPWFEHNFKKHNPNAILHVYDFDKEFLSESHWFKKPSAMLDASRRSSRVCWLDTDCEVRENIESIFDYTVSNKLSMVEDSPWSLRRGETWHNSGVVAFQGRPGILREWVMQIKNLKEVPHKMFGDQDVLHGILRAELQRMVYIRDLPKKFNTLRLDLTDNKAPKKISIMHWTGAKGKEEIKRQMND